MVNEFYKIGKASVYITSYDDVIARILSFIQEHRKGYVCVSNMRTIAVANRNDKYLRVMENSLLNIPDGTPLIWCAKLWGITQAKRVCGPMLFEKMLYVEGLRHFLLGDTHNVLEKIKDKIMGVSGIKIVGYCSPPFAPIETYNIKAMADVINESGANIVWTSLKAPKQDYLNSMLLPFLRDDIILIGVGAAFRVFIGDIKVENGLLSHIGLGGFKMIRKESSFYKEIIWYLKHSAYLSKYMLFILYDRMRGKNYWE